MGTAMLADQDIIESWGASVHEAEVWVWFVSHPCHLSRVHYLLF
jgi:hypothetical protein